ncbi:hypothetical protein HD806DRAFT_528114 [Xylariaceae sp. AK1471]|nr:hypothetical protein HD806DRAFT_528114 [Xylariaceae sp. AK1471]
MAARRTRVWALLFLALHLHGAIAGRHQVARREDATPTVTIAPTTTTAGNEGKETGASPEKSDGSSSTQKHTADTTTTIIVSTSTTAFPSATGNSNLLVPTNPIPAGELPLQPRLTPGWGVAGALLLISGIAYTLIGIKNAWLHTFFSTAFLSGLSVTVLIVYVMAPPIPAAIEGAYVVAAVITGLILGGAATVFREITEGLGCLLGGFCLSMWLLTLRPGGLLTSTTTKVIFIAAFSVGCYGFYFSRHTRPYALMGLISFAGATVTVIGIDCFSKAGLKEFWAYIWNLNKGLFPYGADTYPLTKGIRVEIAVTVVFTIIGIISQLKLWRVIQKRRAKKAEEQAEEQRKRDEEEATLGLQVETQNARERRQWETVYGNQPPRSSAGSGDSGVEDIEDEKKSRISQPVSQRASSAQDGIEMTELPNSDAAASPDPEKKAPAGLMSTQNDDSRVTIRVASEDGPSGGRDAASISNPNEKVWVVNGNGEARPSSIISSRIPPRPSKPPGPEIAPLPFQIPNELEGDTDSRSSVATYADDDDGAYALSNKPSRLSMASRLSVSSGNLLRSLSQRSAHTLNTKRRTVELEAQQSTAWVGSTEELVGNFRRSSDAQSIAATIGGMSRDGDEYDHPMDNEIERKSIPAVTADLGGDTIETNSKSGKATVSKMQLKPPTLGLNLDFRPTSLAETIGTDILDTSVLNLSSGEFSKRSSTNQGTGNTESTNENSNPTDTSAIEATPESSLPSKPSTSKNLTKDRLPSALPRVALSYRTNEWAKHLSKAEAPLPEQLQLDSSPDQQNDAKRETEVAVPVHIEELQQTPERGVPPTAIARSSSSASNLPQVPSPTYRSASRVSSYSPPPQAQVSSSTLAILTGGSPDTTARISPVKTTPPNLPQAGHSLRSKGQRKSNEVYIQPIQEENDNDHLPIKQPSSSDGSGSSTPNSIPPSPTENTPIPGVVSYSSPQTLLGRREMFLRNKSQSQLFTTPPIQENSQYPKRPASQMVSSYSHVITSPYLTQDADDLPLSQRKELIRQSSLLSVNSNGGRPRRDSALNLAQASVSNLTTQIQHITAESSNFDSHQPQRHSTLPPQAVRDARLSNFRQSVAAELRSGTPVVPNSGRETPLHFSPSTTSLLGPSKGNIEVSRTLDQQRNVLMSQREQETQKREMERWEKERNERAFEEMMRRGELVDAHREALRRMQGSVKHG